MRLTNLINPRCLMYDWTGHTFNLAVYVAYLKQPSQVFSANINHII